MSNVDYGPPERLRSNQFWGRRSGSKIKSKFGSSDNVDFVFKIRRGGNAAANNNGPVGRRRTRQYYKAIRAFGEQARSKGWFNGEPIGKNKEAIRMQAMKRKLSGTETK